MDETSAERIVYKVSELTCLLKRHVEEGFAPVWVEGEISNLRRPSSGHTYLTLKDEKATLNGVIFRSSAARLSFRPENGMKVKAYGRLTIYEPQSVYQLIISMMEEAGKGDLQLAFERLKRKLKEEGLFDEARKRPLPFLPRRIGVVTSPTGAAIRDIIQVLTRRYPNIEIHLCPVKVQGEGAAGEIAEGIRRLNMLGGYDVLIVGRGGGSLEDLWAFNEEVVARAVADSSIPVISAVGHEIDFSICDFVADKRAPTPSAAAEIAVPEKAALLDELELIRSRLTAALRRRLDESRSRFVLVAGPRLQRRPRELVESYMQRLDDTCSRMALALRRKLELASQRLSSTREKLDLLDPRRTLERGYVIARDPDNGRPVVSAARAAALPSLELLFKDGEITVRPTGRNEIKARGKAERRPAARSDPPRSTGSTCGGNGQGRLW